MKQHQPYEALLFLLAMPIQFALDIIIYEVCQHYDMMTFSTRNRDFLATTRAALSILPWVTLFVMIVSTILTIVFYHKYKKDLQNTLPMQ